MDRGAQASGSRTAEKAALTNLAQRPVTALRASPAPSRSQELKQSVTPGKTNSGLKIQDPSPVRSQSLARPALVSFRKPRTPLTTPYETREALDSRARPALKSVAREVEGAGLAPDSAGARGAGTSRPLLREGAKGPVQRDPGGAGAAVERRGSGPTS